MQKEQRKARRRHVRYTAWLVRAPNDTHPCALSDISETGARIDVDDSNSVPDKFVLWLASNGAAQRACKVVWRQPKQVGVSFERRLADGERAALVPHETGAAHVA